MNSTDYELLVREIFQQLLDQDKVPNIVVEHDVLKQGLATKHQVDVYWEFRLGGLVHRVAVQAKHWAKRVDQGELLKFKAVLDDLPGTVGIVVTTQGFQDGALEVASSYGITICELREDTPTLPIILTVGGSVKLSPKGFRMAAGGKPFACVMQVDITTPQFFDLKFRGDDDWLRSSGIAPSSLSQMHAIPSEVEFYGGEEKLLCTLQDIYTEWSQEVIKSGEITARKTRSFDQAMFLKIPNVPVMVKIASLSAGVTLRKNSEEREFRAQNVAMFVLKNLADGVIHRFPQFS